MYVIGNRFFKSQTSLNPLSIKTSLQLIKNETLTRVFSFEFCEISKNTFFTEHLRWLLLKIKEYSVPLKLQEDTPKIH